MSDLYSRIQRLKGARNEGSSGERGTERPDPREPVQGEIEFLGLDEWTQVDDQVFERETIDPSVRAPGANVLSTTLGREVPCSSIAFMDTETTGLSGGAGTTVFLVGAGVLTPEGMRVTQTLLGDYPAEPAFLARVERSLALPVWASYNGRAFDARLLESRFLMNARQPLEPEHLDLLYWSRRLWRVFLPACNLGTIESQILDRGREDDIPGIEIPERFFEFTRTRDGSGLARVLEHHRRDIVSLGHLFLRVERLLSDLASGDVFDRFSVGRWLLGRGDYRGVELLEKVARDSRDACDAGTRRREVASVLVSRAYRRAGRETEARALLEELAAAYPHSRTIMIELAKLLEHSARDPDAAFAVVQAYLEQSGAEPDAEVARRCARLDRKIHPGPR